MSEVNDPGRNVGSPAAPIFTLNEKRESRLRAWAQHRRFAYEGENASGRRWILYRLDRGRPVYIESHNETAAVSIGVTPLQDPAGLGIDGTGQVGGLWDVGVPLTNHQEFNSRVTLLETGTATAHATHVAGTILAAGIEPGATGMVPQAELRAFSAANDIAELTTHAAASPTVTGGIRISAHPYGTKAGWVENDNVSGNEGPHWYGVLADGEDREFGRYSSLARDWDELCENNPTIVPVRPAGNHRNDAPPTNGDTFYHYNNGDWVAKAYAAGTDPAGDGDIDSGYDTITADACAKNVLTVGAVTDAVTNAGRVPSAANMVNYSGWGPTDDGRIKPDLVANGSGLYSSFLNRDEPPPTDLYDVRSGTSMAVASTAGAAIALQEVAETAFGHGINSAAMKGLLIHTADDMGRPGPDYEFGWGLINASAAALHLLDAAANQPSAEFHEGTLTTGTTPPDQTYSVTAGKGSIVIATLCWTDAKPGVLLAPQLDNPTPQLVNDLDLRCTRPDGGTIFPFILDPTNPSTNATFGDNTLDNVEQIRFVAQAADDYDFVVSQKSTPNMTTSQAYVLHITVTEPFHQGVDNARPDWSISGNGKWRVDSINDVDNTIVDFVESGNTGHGQAATFEANIQGPIVVNFDWRVSSELNYDKLRFLVDGTERRSISGETDWAYVEEAVPEGTHTLRWTYEKDVNTSAGLDKGFVDAIRFRHAPFRIKTFRMVGSNQQNPEITFQAFPGESYQTQKSTNGGVTWTNVQATMSVNGTFMVALPALPVGQPVPKHTLYRVRRIP
ncbi:MAG: S8 family serine peptidase [Verrucomicrobiota bacterium]